jgi:hypothetical protein
LNARPQSAHWMALGNSMLRARLKVCCHLKLTGQGEKLEALDLALPRSALEDGFGERLKRNPFIMTRRCSY